MRFKPFKLKVKFYRLGIELLDENKRPVEHITYEEENDFYKAIDIYESWYLSKNTAKYLIAVFENNDEILIKSSGYKEK